MGSAATSSEDPMSGADTKPTPPSGMPAAVAATSIAKPSVDEITAPKSEATVVILAAVEALRGEVTTRFERLEVKTDTHARMLGQLTHEVTTHGKQLGELAAAQVSTAKAASAAAEIAVQALSKANSSQDENAKMVQSAMTIQKDAIAAAVQVVVEPIVTKVNALEQNDLAQAATLSAQNEDLAALKKSDERTEATQKEHGEKIDVVVAKVDGVVTSIGTIASGVAKLARWQDAWWVKVLIGVAVFAGSFYAGMRAAPKPERSTSTVIIAPTAPAPLPAAPNSSP